MARPRATELTTRELAVMQVFWKEPEASAEDAHQHIRSSGEDLAYVTVANVVRGLVGKQFLEQTNQRRPFTYRALKSFEQVSKNLVGDLVTKLFEGSREAMLVQLLDRRKLSDDERAYLQQVLAEQEDAA
ncbi:MAG: BlaI/MecI/CopY family transcriptional regulator [Planctomycetota bacterium]